MRAREVCQVSGVVTPRAVGLVRMQSGVDGSTNGRPQGQRGFGGLGGRVLTLLLMCDPTSNSTPILLIVTPMIAMINARGHCFSRPLSLHPDRIDEDRRCRCSTVQSRVAHQYDFPPQLHRPRARSLLTESW